MELIIENEQQRNEAVGRVKRQKLPFTLKITDKARRTKPQNDTQQMWIKEIARQWEGHTEAEVRAHCKLHFGVPILRANSEKFRHDYDRVVKPLDYPIKLALMEEPLGIPVTSAMTRDEMITYLDAIWQFAGKHHWKLTDPDEKLWGMMLASRSDGGKLHGTGKVPARPGGAR